MSMMRKNMSFPLSEERFKENKRQKMTLFDHAADFVVKNMVLFVNEEADFLMQVERLPKPLRAQLLPRFTSLSCSNPDGDLNQFEVMLKGFNALTTSKTTEIELGGLLTYCPFEVIEEKLTEVVKIIAENAPNLESLTINKRNHMDECVIFDDSLGEDVLEEISKLSNLKKLRIDSCQIYYSDLLQLCKALPALEHLEVVFEDTERIDQSMFEEKEMFIESFGKLKAFLFTIYQENIQVFTKFCIENLPKLEIVEGRVDSRSFMRPISKDLILPCGSSSLRHLCTEPLAKPLHLLFPEVTHLKVILRGNNYLESEIEALMNFSGIEFLCLTWFSSLDIVERLLDTYGANLKGLKIECAKCSIKFETIFQKCPQLEQLVLRSAEVEDANRPIKNLSNLTELVWNSDGRGKPAILSNILSAPRLERISLKNTNFDVDDLEKVAYLIAKKEILRHLTSFQHKVLDSHEPRSSLKLVAAVSSVISNASSAIPNFTDVKIRMDFKCVRTKSIKKRFIICQYHFSTDDL